MRRLIAVFLAALLALSAAPALAADETEFEAALAEVKALIEIPEEYVEFDYMTDNCEFVFTWSTEDGDRSVCVSWGDGVVWSYSSSDRGSSGRYSKFKKLAGKTPAQAEQAARDFARELVPAAEEYALAGCEYMNGSYSLQFARMKEGAPVVDCEYSAVVGSDDLRIQYFSQTLSRAETFSGTDAIGAEGVTAAFRRSVEVVPRYNIVYDYDAGERRAVAAYYISDAGGSYVDAETGERFEKDDPRRGGNSVNFAADVVMEADAGAGVSEKSFTEAELDKIGEYSGLLTVAEAARILQEAGFEGAERASGAEVSYSRDRYDEQTVFLRLNAYGDSYSFSASLDAKSGEIIGYYYWTYGDDEFVEKTHEQDSRSEYYIDLAAEFAQSLRDESESGFDFDDPNYYYGGGSAEVLFSRYVNGAIAENNYINVEINTETGKVRGYWRSLIDVEYPEFGAGAEEAAIDAYLELAEPELCHVSSSGVFKAAYVKSDGEWHLFSGADGSPMNYSGESYQPQSYGYTESLEYGDVSGHYAENQINALAQIGIGFSGGAFSPDEIISEKDFVNLLLMTAVYSNYKPYYSDWNEAAAEAVYKEIAGYGIEADNPDGQVTRSLAAKYVVSYLGYSDVAQLQGIFAPEFGDVSQSDPYVGFIAIAKGFGIVGGYDGLYMPDEPLTRGQAAVMIYNMLEVFAE